jgi:hypothetical protein
VIAGLLAALVIAVPAQAQAQAQTRAEYVAQADPICQAAIKPGRKITRPVNRAGEALDAAQKKHKSKKVVIGLAKHFFRVVGRAYSQLGTLSNKTNAGVRAIPPPPEDAALIGQWLAVLDETTQDFFDASKAARHFDFPSLDAADRALSEDFKAADRLVAGFGFKYCAAPVKGAGPAL